MNSEIVLRIEELWLNLHFSERIWLGMHFTQIMNMCGEEITQKYCIIILRSPKSSIHIGCSEKGKENVLSPLLETR